jgi:hypothetical protein
MAVPPDAVVADMRPSAVAEPYKTLELASGTLPGGKSRQIRKDDQARPRGRSHEASMLPPEQTAEVDSLKVLDPEWPIREADIEGVSPRESSCSCGSPSKQWPSTRPNWLRCAKRLRGCGRSGWLATPSIRKRRPPTRRARRKMGTRPLEVLPAVEKHRGSATRTTLPLSG